mmetsp:Transcript_11310/g.19042  ORF Transcript_11310/g.19042 Transcript_11310/m.19042 type:complete len:207 (+) Transcript_11310:33-653(+)
MKHLAKASLLSMMAGVENTEAFSLDEFKAKILFNHDFWSKNMLEKVYYLYPSLQPNDKVNLLDPHHMDKDHYVQHDFRLKFKGIADEYDYRYEEYDVTTEDGYVLKVQRIRNPMTPPNGPVVFLQHAITDTSFGWIAHHSDESPAMVLASEGYDVWFGNYRGSTLSRKHLKLNPDSKNHSEVKDFFDFSWQEMGDYDLEPMINFVL